MSTEIDGPGATGAAPSPKDVKPPGPSESSTHDDPSPRALRAMAVVRWLLFAAVLTTAAGSWWLLVLSGDAPTGGEPRYYCPMHPEIRSHDPGTCPICFMTLEPIPEDLGAPAAEHDGHDEHERAPEAGGAPSGTAPLMLTTERLQASGIAVVPVRRAETASEVRWPAVVEALEGARVEVRVRTEAFVERLVVRESGVRVRRGEVLAWVYAPEILAAEEELLTAHRLGEGHARVAEAATRRLELLGVPRADIDAVIRAGEARRRVPLRAPERGVVTRLGAVRGTYASPETVLYEITDHTSVRVLATALASGELALADASSALFRPRGASEDVPLALELIEPVLDESSRAARARFLADNAAGALRPGDIGDVWLEGRAERLVVPRDAVIDRGRERYVFVETAPGFFSPRVVTVGELRGDEREILAGLEERERVVARGGFVLDSESRLSAALAPREAHAHGAEGDGP